MVLRCLLILTPKATILVETGMGDKATPEIAESQNLRLERSHGWLAERQALIVFQHEPLIAAGRLIAQDGRYMVEKKG